MDDGVHSSLVAVGSCPDTAVGWSGAATASNAPATARTKPNRIQCRTGSTLLGSRYSCAVTHAAESLRQSGLMLLADKASTIISAHDASGQPSASSRKPALVGSTAACLPASLTAYATGGSLCTSMAARLVSSTCKGCCGQP